MGLYSLQLSNSGMTYIFRFSRFPYSLEDTWSGSKTQGLNEKGSLFLGSHIHLLGLLHYPFIQPKIFKWKLSTKASSPNRFYWHFFKLWITASLNLGSITVMRIKIVETDKFCWHEKGKKSVCMWSEYSQHLILWFFWAKWVNDRALLVLWKIVLYMIGSYTG